MRLTAFFAISIWLASAAGAAAANATVEKAIGGFIRPAYKSFATSTAALAEEMGDLCAVPDKANLEGARREFRLALADWSRIEIVRFGPITEQNRLDRVLYWPDRKGIGLRQVQAAIAGNDASFESTRALVGKSVAVQGFGALEFVLYGTGFEDLTTRAGAHRCRYGEAIAGNLREIASDVSDAWQAPDGFARTWANPGPDNKLYRTDEEAVTELLAIFVNGLELVRDTRLGAFLGPTADDDKPKLAIFWRSNATVLSLENNLAGMKELFETTGLGALATGENAYLANSIGFEFANVARALSGEGKTPIADALKDGVLRGKLDYFRVVTSSLSDLFGTKLSGALGLTVGFSSLDGD